MEFLSEYHLAGLFIGICTFLIIGLFHPVVVKAEYYWGTKCWWIFLILGIAGVVASLSIENVIIASLLSLIHIYGSNPSLKNRNVHQYLHRCRLLPFRPTSLFYKEYSLPYIEYIYLSLIHIYYENNQQ